MSFIVEDTGAFVTVSAGAGCTGSGTSSVSGTVTGSEATTGSGIGVGAGAETDSGAGATGAGVGFAPFIEANALCIDARKSPGFTGAANVGSSGRVCALSSTATAFENTSLSKSVVV